MMLVYSIKKEEHIMNKQEKFVEALEALMKAAREVNESWPQDDYSSKEYAFNEDFNAVVCNIENWYYAEQEILDAPWQEKIAEQYEGIKPWLIGWHYDNTGGHCMVSYKDYVCKDGIKRMIGLNDESMSIFDVCYDVCMTNVWQDMNDMCEAELLGFSDLHDNRPDINYMLEQFDHWLTEDQCNDILIGLFAYIAVD
jgi:hypothetical protein